MSGKSLIENLPHDIIYINLQFYYLVDLEGRTMEIDNLLQSDLSDYEKMIFFIANTVGNKTSLNLSESNIEVISNFLKVTPGFFSDALRTDTIRFNLNHFRDFILLHPKLFDGLFSIEDENEKKYWDDFENAYSISWARPEPFESLVQLILSFDSLNDLKDGESYDDIMHNYSIFLNCINSFEIINASMASYESFWNGYYSIDFAIYNSALFQPRKMLSLLLCYSKEDFSSHFDKSFIHLLCRVLSYELTTHLNCIYLVLITQIIRHCFILSDSIRNIANELYDYFVRIFQNGLILSFQTNCCPVLKKDLPEERSKEDNTTRFQILYGFENLDIYCMRLDFAHKGQNIVHYNNTSPGDVQCCILDKTEYQKIVNANPSASMLFIRYGRKYALKEPGNLNLTSDEMSLYNSIQQSYAHFQAFSDQYDEHSITQCLEILIKMLPSQSNTKIDINGRFANNCFVYNKIMFYSILFETEYLQYNDPIADYYISQIVSLAVKEKIITSDEISEYSCIEGISLIIDEAQKRIMQL